MSHLTHYGSFQGQPSRQPLNWWEMQFKPNQTATKLQTKTECVQRKLI